MNVTNRIDALADALDLELTDRGADENDIRAIAEFEEIPLPYSGSDENLLDALEAAIAERDA